MSTDRAVKAVEQAANEVIIFQAEQQIEVINQARKRRKGIEDLEENEEENRVEKEVDDTDGISVIGHSKSLMSLVRAHGLKVYSKNLKDCCATEKYYARLSLNSIVVLQDEAYMGLLDISNEATLELKKQFPVSPAQIPQLKDNLKNMFEKTAGMDWKQKHKFLTIKSFDFSGDDSKKLSIMANIYKVIGQENSILNQWQSSSEWTIIIKIWASLFETLFEDTNIDLIWGDTQNDAFKVDFRLCVVAGKKKYDISNIEFKKNGNRLERKKDAAKLLIEGKHILNRLIKEHNLDLEESKKKKAMVAQVCGLKATLSEVRLVASGCYVPSQYGKTVKYPYDSKSAKLFLDQNLQQLFAYKDHVIEEARSMRDVLRKDTSSLGSRTATEDQSFIKHVYLTQESMTKWPRINADFFKQ